ncbi:helix-turn-helix domain-containing protein [Francisella sp. SYW-9]|uniref:AlbA family DNA-binding domain-containing protein n=1 Tax=Francisella sp. SYW-9 TaxID=2610888 RepID=UPI00168D6FA5|nr:ATP-binding protein [Francisella sp. SYW-9]
MNNHLKTIVSSLIALKKEGIYWDFKQCHHHNTCDLIHDIICLANTKHQGNRYLIFGVNDSCEIIGLNSDDQKKQADIIDTLRNSNFANNIFPDVTLENIKISDKPIQVLTIRDKQDKPYYLSKKKDKLNAGTIYTRTMDTNTPKSNVASAIDIEYMWKERFGLTQNPLERFKIYLKNDTRGWDLNSNDIFFYKQHPEFTKNIS